VVSRDRMTLFVCLHDLTRNFDHEFDCIQYDTIQESNVELKAQCDKLNLAQETQQTKPMPT